MANARVIRQNYFNEPKLQKYSIDERYLIIGLACTADDYGRLWKDSMNIKSIVFPTNKSITEQWINKTINKLIKNNILCEYEEEKIRYIHFPKWFDKGWFLKQRIDHPKEFGGCPDCPICNTEELKNKLRETSRAIKDNIIKPNQINNNTSNTNTSYLKIVGELSARSFIEHTYDKYPLITNSKYVQLLSNYIESVNKQGAWERDHVAAFDKYLDEQHELLRP